MRKVIEEGLRRHIKSLTGLEDARILEISPGHAKIEIEITEGALNLYGKLHGGFIFSLCDMVSGMATYAYEVKNVTLQGNINFIKGVEGGTIHAEANTLHKGGTTVVNRVEVTTAEGVLLAEAQFTMFLFEPIP